MAYVMDQIRGSLSSIRTLCKMLTVHVKKSEIPYDVVEDILVQGEHIRDTLQELQDAVYMTKANIMRYNEESLKRISSSANKAPDRESCQLPQNLLRDYSSKLRNSTESSFPLISGMDDLEMPMPPLSLAPLDTVGIRPCMVSEVLSDMVEAVKPLARMQQRVVELNDLSRPLQVVVEEPALRQGLSNLIEGALLRTQTGGKVDIVSTRAPAGGVLVVIDDDGPDMHYMTQMHSLTPFGADLFSEGMIEDNMTWNFIAGLTVAREILESYGCVVRVISPRSMDAAVGSGGTRVELWLPSLPETPN
ncbi:Chloroplast sensor kinase, chloroplastic [Linum grandiflorum]